MAADQRALPPLPTLADAGQAIRERRLTSEALTEQCLQAIAAREGELNAFITVTADLARAQARAADAEIAAGRWRGPLHGVPVSLKDLIDVDGVPTTAASRLREGHVAAADAPVTARLREAGAVLIGKTNLHEFAFGTTNEDSGWGPARHPLDPGRSPGGSSGGSAASVLAGMAVASVGTDTGGSIRIPAAVCGLVGLKPTLSELPTDGVVPLSTTMDHVGPIARTVEDARLLHQALLGRATPDAATAPPPRPLRGLRLGVPRPYFLALLDDAVAASFERSCARLREAGVTLVDVAIRHADDIAPIYLHIVLAEAAAYHATALERSPAAYTPNVRIRLEMGRYVLAEDYARARRGRVALRVAVDEALGDLDGLLLPTLPMVAQPIGAATVRLSGVDEPIRNAMLRLTQLFDITGHPAITLPDGANADGLPTGIQLAGRVGDTAGLLALAAGLEPILTPPTSRR